jgi:hypothetical protein
MVKNRKLNEFGEETKRVLAYKAGMECSFPGCRQRTAGPSREGERKYTNLGVAAHIYGAAPGSARYRDDMSNEERRHISNAIWLCQTDAKKIDDDEVTYTPEILGKMREDHEARIEREHFQGGQAAGAGGHGLVGLGPNLVFAAELTHVAEGQWVFKVDAGAFPVGDLNGLVSFIGNFSASSSLDRYVLVNAIGEGRVLAAAPTLERAAGSVVVRCAVQRPAERIPAARLPSELGLNSNHDMHVVNGSLARVSGIDALPQRMTSALSMSRGESWMNPAYGARFAECVARYENSPWLADLFKLEVIRLACIPNENGKTTLLCVERVHHVALRIQVTGTRMNWHPCALKLGVAGFGLWESETEICVPPYAAIQERIKLFADTMQPKLPMK